MSNKPKTAATKEDGKPALVPKLRFPDFRDAEGWDEKRLGSEGEFLTSLSGKAGDDFDTGEAKFVTYMNVFSNTFVDPKALRLVNVKEGENQNEVASGDVFFTISSETPEEVGMSSVLLEEIDNCYLNSFCALFRFSKSEKPNPVFTGYLLRQPLVRRYFTKKAQGSTRFNLSKDAFKNLPIFVPQLPEQQKISNCLSSVDELIAAQGRKLDALKTHKKGLLQQLFPREGETQPRLRFPEFRNGPKWEMKKIGRMLNETPRPIALEDESEYCLVTVKRRYGGLVSRGVLKGKEIKVNSQFLVKADDFLISKRQIVHNACGLVPIDLDGSVVSNEYSVLTAAEGCDIHFFDYFAQQPYVSESFMQCSVGIVIEKMLFKLDRWLKTEFSFPIFGEQQRIADCLNSLDDLITAQAQKLEALKTHKKGLMQQLFPFPDEVKA